MGLFVPFAGFRRVAPEKFGPFTLFLVRSRRGAPGNFAAHVWPLSSSAAWRGSAPHTDREGGLARGGAFLFSSLFFGSSSTSFVQRRSLSLGHERGREGALPVFIFMFSLYLVFSLYLCFRFIPVLGIFCFFISGGPFISAGSGGVVNEEHKKGRILPVFLLGG